MLYSDRLQISFDLFICQVPTVKISFKTCSVSFHFSDRLFTVNTFDSLAV